MKEGCLHIYTGDGKGKTTTAAGLAVRAAGQGLKVAFFQFLKSGDSGEIKSLEKLGVQVFSPHSGHKFIFQMDDGEKRDYAAVQQNLLRQAEAACADYDLVVLDEALGALSTGMLARAALIAFLKNRPVATELVLTGRGADDELVALADYCTEMVCRVHPYDKGRPARRGIEF